MPKEKVKRGIILADLQFPHHNPKLLDVFERYMSSQKWDFLIYLGDFMDMDAISHHAFDAGDVRALEGKRLKNDYVSASDILRRHRGIVGKGCKTVFLLGNHEEWAEKFLDRYPQLEGFLELRNNLPFKELNIEVIEPRHHFKLDKMLFVHGDMNNGFGSKHHAMRMVETFNRNVIYGHHHTLQTFTKISPAGIDETHTAQCIPCMAEKAPEWAKDRPNAWLDGFGVFFTTSETFTMIPIVAAKDSFISPEGVLWK